MQVFVKRYSSEEREAHTLKLPRAKFIATSQHGDVQNYTLFFSAKLHRAGMWRDILCDSAFGVRNGLFLSSGWRFVLDVWLWWTTRGWVEHLLLTSWPTLRAEEEEEEDAEEAWWRGLCRWGMWSRLGWEDADPVWLCCWTHRQS